LAVGVEETVFLLRDPNYKSVRGRLTSRKCGLRMAGSALIRIDQNCRLLREVVTKNELPYTARTAVMNFTDEHYRMRAVIRSRIADKRRFFAQNAEAGCRRH
jgi:hypothetical protein